MIFIIVLAIYDGVNAAVPTFLFWLVVWYGLFFASGFAEADDMLGI